MQFEIAKHSIGCAGGNSIDRRIGTAGSTAAKALESMPRHLKGVIVGSGPQWAADSASAAGAVEETAFWSAIPQQEWARRLATAGA